MKKSADINYQLQVILSRRDHSIVETRRKLAKKGFSSTDITAAIQIARQKKYLDDSRFAANYINSILRQKPVGPRWLQAKLAQKGLSSELIISALERHYPPELESDLIKQATQKWRALHSKDQNNQEKLTRFLISRGFSLDKITSPSTA